MNLKGGCRYGKESWIWKDFIAFNSDISNRRVVAGRINNLLSVIKF